MRDSSIRDFFVSYARRDRKWAEWIAWQLKEAGYSVWIQAWHFVPGGNWVLDMDHGAKAKRTIAVLSDDYLKSDYTSAEWSAAYARDPAGEHRTLVPVRVARCEPDGVLGPRTYIDLIGLSEKEAHAELIAGLNRGKASTPPIFPGPAEESSSQPELGGVAKEPSCLPAPAGAANQSSPPQEQSEPGGFFTPEPSTFPRRMSTPGVWREKAVFFRSLAARVNDPETKAGIVKQAEEAEQRLRQETKRVTALAVLGLIVGIAGMTQFTWCGGWLLLHSLALLMAGTSLAVLLFTTLQSRIRPAYQGIVTAAVPPLLAVVAYLLLPCTYSIVVHVFDEHQRPVTRGSLKAEVKESVSAQITNGHAVLKNIPGRFRNPRYQAFIFADIENSRLDPALTPYSLDGPELPLHVKLMRISATPPAETNLDRGWPQNTLNEIAALGPKISLTQMDYLRTEYFKGYDVADRLVKIPREDHENVPNYFRDLVGTMKIMYQIQKKTGDLPKWATLVEDAKGHYLNIMNEVEK